MNERPHPHTSPFVLKGKNIAFFLIGLFLLVFLLFQIDLNVLMEQILGVRGEFFLAGGVLYLIKASLRAVRLNQISADIRLPYLRTLRLSLATSLATQFLPFKLGEFGYVYLLKQEKNTPVTQGLSVLVVIRLMDLMAIAALYLAIAFSLRSVGDTAQIEQALLFLALLSGGFGSFLLFSHCSPPLLRKMKGVGIFKNIPFAYLLGQLEKFLGYFQTYRPVQMGKWLGLALLEWICNYAMFHLLLLGMEIPVTIYHTATAVTFAAVASALPVNVVGSFGSQEAGWTTALLMLQFERQIAITTAFSTHLLSAGYIVFFGGLAWLSYLLPVRLRRE